MTIQLPVSKDGKKIVLDLDSRVFNPSVASTALLYAIADEDIARKKVFDVGVGTGCLGIGTLLRGAAFLYGIDANPAAVRLSKHNAKINHLEQKCEIVAGDMMQPQFKVDTDVIISNPPLMPSCLERSDYGPDSSTNAGDGSKYAIRVLEVGREIPYPDVMVYIPIFSFSNPNKIMDYAREHYKDVKVVLHQDVIFDLRKLAQMDIFEKIFQEGDGYRVAHNSHPYWRIEILRCQGPKFDRCYRDRSSD